MFVGEKLTKLFSLLLYGLQWKKFAVCGCNVRHFDVALRCGSSMKTRGLLTETFSRAYALDRANIARYPCDIPRIVWARRTTTVEIKYRLSACLLSLLHPRPSGPCYRAPGSRTVRNFTYSLYHFEYFYDCKPWQLESICRSRGAADSHVSEQVIAIGFRTLWWPGSLSGAFTRLLYKSIFCVFKILSSADSFADDKVRLAQRPNDFWFEERLY